MATFDANSAYSIVFTQSGTFYEQNGHYFTTGFVDLGTTAPSSYQSLSTERSDQVNISGGLIDSVTIGSNSTIEGTVNSTGSTLTNPTITGGTVSGSTVTGSTITGGSINGTLTTTGVATLTSGFTVGTLPAASTALKGARAFVTDAASPTWNSPVTGGSSNTVPVSCNGNAWVCG